jgi:hypothetical protein
MSTGSSAPVLEGSALARPSVAEVERSRARRLPWADYLAIVSIVGVVILVSIPRLRAFAVRENELDAVHMLRALAMQPAPIGGEQAGNDLARLVARDPALQRRLEDVECLDNGRLRRHGYLFDMTMMRPGEPMLRAWPWNHGQTGRGAYVWTPQRGLIGCSNADGRFSGPQSPPAAADIGEQWRAVTERR